MNCRRHPSRFRKLLGATLVMSAMTCSLMVGSAHASETLGFVATWFGLGIKQGAKDCPEGFALRTEAKTVLSRFPKARQEELQRGQNAAELQKLMVGRGPRAENVCENPEAPYEPPMRTVQGSNPAFGLDLDGNDGRGPTPANICKHTNFSGFDGKPGVDNQLYRAIGCMTGWSEDGVGGYLSKFFNSTLLNGEASVLIEVTGATDLKNDEVQVGLYVGATPMPKDAVGKGILSDGSITIKSDSHWQNVTKGKIVNGVLTTEPIDVHLHGSKNDMREWFFRDARLRLELKEDGTAQGVLAGYQDWVSFYRQWGNPFQEALHGMTCPTLFSSLKRNADAYPDPETGECTAISLAYKIEAIPTFIIHPESKDSKPKDIASDVPARVGAVGK